MPEVPEHLLQRSRERREALGLASSTGAPATAAAEGGSESVPATTSAAAPAAAVAAPAVIEEPPVPTGPDPRVLRLEEARQRRIPTWVFPVLVALPLWSILYIGAFGSHKKVVA